MNYYHANLAKVARVLNPLLSPTICHDIIFADERILTSANPVVTDLINLLRIE